MHVTIT